MGRLEGQAAVRIQVDPDAALPAYEQIRLQISRLIADGTYSRGAQLPTIRQLASDLGLSKGTVERAYVLLESDGLIETRSRAGTTVTGPAKAAGAEIDRSGVRDAPDVLAVAAVVRGLPLEIVLDEVRDAYGRIRPSTPRTSGDPTGSVS